MYTTVYTTVTTDIASDTLTYQSRHGPLLLVVMLLYKNNETIVFSCEFDMDYIARRYIVNDSRAVPYNQLPPLRVHPLAALSRLLVES